MTRLSSFLYLLALFSTVKTNNAVLSPQPPVDCTTLILTMSDCLNFVKIGSDIQKPQVPCCNALKNVLKTDAGCLCEAFKLASANGLVLNVTKALTLPSACGVKSPPLGDCGFYIAPPTASPVNPPKPSPPSKTPPSPPAPPRTPPVTPPAPPSPESEEPQVPTPAPAPAPEKAHKSGVSAHSVYFPVLLGSLFVVSLAYF